MRGRGRRRRLTGPHQASPAFGGTRALQGNEHEAGRRSDSNPDLSFRSYLDRFSESLVRALRGIEENKIVLPQLSMSSTHNDVSSWRLSIERLENSSLSPTARAELIRNSLNTDLQNAITSLEGLNYFHQANAMDVQRTVVQLLNPSCSTIGRSTEVLSCKQLDNEPVSDYFFRKTNLINSLLPRCDTAMKITLLQEGLLPQYRKRATTLCRGDTKLTLYRYLSILQETEAEILTWKAAAKPWERKQFHDGGDERFRDSDKVEKPQAAKAQQTRKEQCTICGYSNHSAKDCRRRPDSKNRKGRSNARRGDFSRMSVSDSMTAPVSLNGVRIDGIIDTGAEVSLIRGAVARSCNLQLYAKNMQLTTSNGSKSAIEYAADVKLRFFTEDVDAHLAVVDDLHGDLILGLDFLRKHKFVIDVSGRCLWFKDEQNCQHKFPLGYEITWKDSESLDKRSVEQKSEKSPINRESKLQGHTDCAFHWAEEIVLPPSSRTWVRMTSTAETETDVLLVPSLDLLLNRMVRIPAGLCKTTASAIFIANFTEKPQLLKRGTLLATGTPPDSIKDFVVKTESDGVKTKVIRRSVKAGVGTASSVEDVSVNISGRLSTSETASMKCLLNSYTDRFAKRPSELKESGLQPMQITLQVDAQPRKSQPYRQPVVIKTVIEEQIEEMLSAGIIEPSTSEWASPVILVKKKNGSWRFCVDFRKLNEQTVGLSYPLPHIEDSLDKLRGARYFTSLDMYSGFWQIPLAEDSKQYTAFTTHCGLFQFTRVCFGLKNSPTYFQRCMDSILRKLSYRNAMVYVDDVIIWSHDFHDHLTQLQSLLDLLRDADLKLNSDKCFFAFDTLKYLGHVISKTGVVPDPEKVSAIIETTAPKSLKSLRRFLGMTNYYRRFIEQYSSIARPLFDLLKVGAKFTWNESCSYAFDKLKEHLSSAPIIEFYQHGKPLALFTDASGVAVGGVLRQQIADNDSKWGVLGYFSRTLTPTEARYSATEREFLAILQAIKHFRVYLFGQDFTVFTDHKPISQIKDQLKSASERIRRWCLQLYDYNFVIKYKEGRINFDADYLSRLETSGRLEDTEDEIIAYSAVARDSTILNLQENDVFCQVKRQQIRLGKATATTDGEVFVVANDIWYRVHNQSGVEHRQVVVPLPGRQEIIRVSHEAGHFGKVKSFKVIELHYWWPEMREDVFYFVRRCETCSKRRSRLGAQRGRLVPLAPQIPLPVYGIFSMIGFDIIVFDEALKTQRQSRYVMVAIDYLTRYAIAKATTRQTASEVKRFLLEDVFLSYGFPQYLITDQGANIKSDEVSTMLESFNVEHITTSPFHPCANGLVEKLHGILKTIISSHVSANRKNWDVWLPFAVSAYNSSPHGVTQFTPFYLVHGVEFRDGLKNKFKLREFTSCQTESELNNEQLKALQDARLLAWENLIEKAASDVQADHMKRAHLAITQGQHVMVYNAPINAHKRSLWSPWEGPYVVVRQLALSTYEVVNIKDPMLVKRVPSERLRVVHLPFPEKTINKDACTSHVGLSRSNRPKQSCQQSVPLIGHLSHEQSASVNIRLFSIGPRNPCLQYKKEARFYEPSMFTTLSVAESSKVEEMSHYCSMPLFSSNEPNSVPVNSIDFTDMENAYVPHLFGAFVEMEASMETVHEVTVTEKATTSITPCQEITMSPSTTTKVQLLRNGSPVAQFSAQGDTTTNSQGAVSGAEAAESSTNKKGPKRHTKITIEFHQPLTDDTLKSYVAKLDPYLTKQAVSSTGKVFATNDVSKLEWAAAETNVATSSCSFCASIYKINLPSTLFGCRCCTERSNLPRVADKFTTIEAPTRLRSKLDFEADLVHVTEYGELMVEYAPLMTAFINNVWNTGVSGENWTNDLRFSHELQVIIKIGFCTTFSNGKMVFVDAPGRIMMFLPVKAWRSYAKYMDHSVLFDLSPIHQRVKTSVAENFGKEHWYRFFRAMADTRLHVIYGKLSNGVICIPSYAARLCLSWSVETRKSLAARLNEKFIKDFYVPGVKSVVFASFSDVKRALYKDIGLPPLDSTFWWNQQIYLATTEATATSEINDALLQIKAHTDFSRFAPLTSMSMRYILPPDLHKKFEGKNPAEDAGWRVMRTIVNQLIEDKTYEAWKEKLYDTAKGRWKLNSQRPEKSLLPRALLSEVICIRMKSIFHGSPRSHYASLYRIPIVQGQKRKAAYAPPAEDASDDEEEYATYMANKHRRSVKPSEDTVKSSGEP